MKKVSISTVVDISTTVAADGKKREMVCIPVKYVFGWLFTIDVEKVKSESREKLIQYKLKCYDILYEKFFIEGQFMKLKTEKENSILEEINVLQSEIDQKKAVMKEAKSKLENVKQITFEDYKRDKSQLVLFFPEK